jgi:hypothetical protein
MTLLLALLACSPDPEADGPIAEGDTDTDTDSDTGTDCPDADGDGSLDAACGGDDCDDADPDIHPGALDPAFSLGEPVALDLGRTLRTSYNARAFFAPLSTGEFAFAYDAVPSSGGDMLMVCTGLTGLTCDEVAGDYEIDGIAVSASATLGVDTVVVAGHYTEYSSQDIWAGKPGQGWATYRAGRNYASGDVATDPATGEVWVLTALYDTWLDRVIPAGDALAVTDRVELGSLGETNAVFLDLAFSDAGPVVGVGIPYEGTSVYTDDGSFVETGITVSYHMSARAAPDGVAYAVANDGSADTARRIQGGSARPYSLPRNLSSVARGVVGRGLALADTNGTLFVDVEGDGTFEQFSLGHVPFGDIKVIGDQLYWIGIPDYPGDQNMTLYHATVSLPDGVDQDCDGSDG